MGPRRAGSAYSAIIRKHPLRAAYDFLRGLLLEEDAFQGGRAIDPNKKDIAKVITALDSLVTANKARARAWSRAFLQAKARPSPKAF